MQSPTLDGMGNEYQLRDGGSAVWPCITDYAISTYNVFSGTLNPTQSINQSTCGLSGLRMEDEHRGYSPIEVWHHFTSMSEVFGLLGECCRQSRSDCSSSSCQAGQRAGLSAADSVRS